VSERTGRGRGTCLLRAFFILITGFLILVLVGMVYETVASEAAWEEYPPPGERVDVGDYYLHVHVEGEAGELPVVILDNGGTSLSAQWAWIMPELAEHTQVVAYDRPGMGWSGAPPEPIDAADAVRDLRQALQALEIEGPYVLVGHSMGALTMRVFAQLYPDEVAGLVLIDPRDITWEGVYEEEPQLSSVALWTAGAVSRVGIVRLFGPYSPDLEGLPEEARQQSAAIAYSHHHFRSLGIEGHIGDSAAAWLWQNENLLDVPMLVLSAGDPGGGFDADQRSALTALHVRLAEIAPQGEHRVIPAANHVTLVTHQEPAQEVEGAILEIMMDPSVGRSE
jgi:pimeloyl-ACP methyl ester carboxylesterase